MTYGGSSQYCTVLEDALTCIVETLSTVDPACRTANIVNPIPKPELACGEADAGLLEAMRIDAERDREIAAEPLRMPRDLYEKKKVHVELERPLDVANLDDLQMARALFDVPTIAVLCRAKGIQQIDRGVFAGQALDVTRAISGHIMREPVFGTRFPGLAAPSRHPGAGFSYALSRHATACDFRP